MLTQITAERAIRQHWEALEKQIRQAGHPIESCRLTYRPGHVDSTVYWLPNHGFWACCRDDVAKAKNRYWNAFGHGRPQVLSTLKITCEICIPMDSPNRRVAGAFGKDISGLVYLLHNGRIGGGKTGVGKEVFLAGFKGTLGLVNDGRSDLRQMIVLGQLGSASLLERISEFVREARKYR